MSFIRTLGHTLLSAVCLVVAVELYHAIEIITLVRDDIGE